MRYACIAEQESYYPREILCSVLEVSTSGYANWKRGHQGRKRLSDAHLLVLIQAIHQESKGTYGSPRIFDEMKDAGYSVSRSRIERLMREHQIQARSKRRYRVTTDSNHGFAVAPNRLDRQFNPSQPGHVYSADITFIPTGEGWLYLAVVLDLFDRSVVGWSMQNHMQTELVSDALRMAYSRRRPEAGALHHSDRGSQYASREFQTLLKEFGMVCSMSRKGNCWDNAPTESFFSRLKNERVHGARYACQDEAKADIFDYIELFYNQRRRHSALGGQSPHAVYSAWALKQNLTA